MANAAAGDVIGRVARCVSLTLGEGLGQNLGETVEPSGIVIPQVTSVPEDQTLTFARPPRRGAMSSRSLSALRFALLALWAAALLASAFLARGTGATSAFAPSTVAALFALAFIPYAPLALDPRELPLGLALGLAALVGLAFIGAPFALSDDLYRFLWDGRVTLAGLDPFAYAPSDPALAALRDPLHARINHAEIPTIYPPGAQALFALAELLGHHERSPRLLALVAHLVVGFLLRRRGATAWLLNPLALTESALGGHVDVFVGLAILASATAFADRREGRAVVFASAAAAVKLVGILLLPFAWRDRRALALGGLLVVALVFPLAGAGRAAGDTGGFGHYARRWGGNVGGFLIVEGLVCHALEPFALPDGRVGFEFARPVLTALAGSALDPHAAFVGPKKPIHDVAVFERHVAASLLARLLGALTLLVLVAYLARRVVKGDSAPEASRTLLLVALLLAPQNHPWYLLWLLPLELSLGRHAVLVWSALALGAYAPLDLWWTERVWVEPRGLGLLQHAAVVAIWWCERRRHRVSRNGPSPAHRRELSRTRV